MIGLVMGYEVDGLIVGGHDVNLCLSEIAHNELSQVFQSHSVAV